MPKIRVSYRKEGGFIVKDEESGLEGHYNVSDPDAAREAFEVHLEERDRALQRRELALKDLRERHPDHVEA